MPESLPNDGRQKYEWRTKYIADDENSVNPLKVMRMEAVYLVVLMALAFVALIANYKGFFVELLGISGTDIGIITRIIYCLCAGLLGGVTFSIKIFYRAVARGQWNYDRRYWRMFSPLISLSVTSVVAMFMIDDIISSHIYWTYTIGYFAGYFSENAVGKMYDIAVVLFSSPAKEGNKEEAVEDERKDDKSN